MITKVVVAGGREFEDFDLLERKLNNILKDCDKVEIVSGKAKGADTLGERYAKKYGHSIKAFPADWKTHGNAAGPIRNKQMAEYGDAVVCFWDGKSTGTRSMINLAKDYGLQLRIIRYDKKEELMIENKQGNVLEQTECRVICHQVNCFSTMGAGIAKQIKEKYPVAFAVDKNSPLTPSEKLGKCTFGVSKADRRVIFNLYGQFEYGRQKQNTNYADLLTSMDEMCKVLKEKNYVGKIGIPFNMGCGLGGGEWDKVLDLITKVIVEKHKYKVVIFKL